MIHYTFYYNLYSPDKSKSLLRSFFSSLLYVAVAAAAVGAAAAAAAVTGNTMSAV